MGSLSRFGQVLFAVALIGLGIDHFVFGDFVTARAPAWPAALPGKFLWASATGVAFIVSGLAILLGRSGRVAAVGAGGLILLWALLRHIPLVAASPLLSNAWTRAGKAVWFVGGALAVAAAFPPIATSSAALTRLLNRDSLFVLAGRACVGLVLIMNGVQHFIYVEFVASLIPDWFPGYAVFWTYFAGAALIAGGTGLMIRKTAQAAALLSGTMILFWVFIVHLSQEISGTGDGIAIFEAPAIAGILFVLAAHLGKAAESAPRHLEGPEAAVSMTSADR